MAASKRNRKQSEPNIPIRTQIDETVTRSILDMLNGYAYCRMLFKDGKPSDFICLRVNKAFETLTGLKDVVGKKVSEVIPGIQQADPQLFEIYGRVAQTGQPERFETFIQSLQMWFSVSVHCPQPQHFVAVFDEINEKKRLESALAENEKRLREVLEYSLDAAYKRSLQQDTYEYFSPVITRLTGYTPEEMKRFNTQCVLSLMHPEDIPQVKNVLSASLLERPGKAHQVEYRFQHKDGGYCWLQDKFVVICGDQGQPEALIGSVSDISARKEAEQTAQAQAQRSQILLDNSRDGIHVLDEEGRVVEANPAFCEMLGYTRAELLQMQVADWDAQWSKQELLTRINDLIARPTMFETQHRRKDGSIRDVEINAVGVSFYGRPHLYATSRDVSERKRAEERIKTSEARLRAIIDASPIPMALNDDQQNITSLNIAFYQTYGYTLADIPTLTDWWPKAYPDLEYRQWVANTWEARLAAAKKTGLPFQPLEIKVRCKDGAEKTVIASAAAISDGFEGVHLVVLYDISERKRYEQALRESEENLQIALQSAEIGMWSLNVQTMTGRVDSRAAQILGYQREDIPNEKIGWDRLTHPDDVAKIEKILMAHLKGEIPIFESEHRMLHADGRYIWVNGRGKVTQFDPDGAPLIVSGTILNINERKAAESELDAQRDFATQIVNLMGQGLTVTDRDGKFEFINPAYAAMLGSNPEDLLGKHPSELTVPEERSLLAKHKRLRQDGRTSTYEIRLQRADGGTVPVVITGVPRKSGETHGGYSSISVITDLSEQKWIEAELRSAKSALEQALEREQVLARTDALTGVNNRRQLFALTEGLIAVAVRYQQTMAVLMFDIDHFKQVNDTYGHDIGDRVLQQVVQTACAELRAADVIGRYGGEEFIIVLPQTSAGQALQLAERIRTNAANLVVISERGGITLTLSIGIVELQSGAQPESVETLFRRADRVMYSAKFAGRNRTMMEGA